MAKITRTLSAKVNAAGESEIYFRYTLSRTKQIRIKSGLYINPARFKDGQVKKPRANQKEVEALTALETQLINLERRLIEAAQVVPAEGWTRDYFDEVINRANHPERYDDAPEVDTRPAFMDVFAEYYTAQPLSSRSVARCKVLSRALQRYELFKRAEGAEGWALELDEFGRDEAAEFYDFLAAEHLHAEKYPEIYATIPSDTRAARKRPKQEQRGQNAVVNLMRCLRAFFNWANLHEYTTARPFSAFDKPMTENYGTPYYLTQEERNTIAAYELTASSDKVQRDIFIFQCLIGCRVSDLERLTPADIVGGAVEYIPEKTKHDRAAVVRVPLNPQARALVEKYAGADPRGRLFPFISSQKYNEAIKRIFTVCGITRPVTVLDPKTGKEVKRPINELASSHIARRTFVGNLYKQVKDPNLIGALSGHKEGSRAFARYRDIDEELKREVVNLLK